MILDKINTIILPQLEEELKNILEFWANNTLDHRNGGFVAELNGEGELSECTEKGAVLNTRLLWTFSAAYNFSKDAAYLKLADRAYKYLTQYFWDKEYGGLYWSVNTNGKVENSRKQAYAQGFGIYGFSEYYKASDKKESLDYAIQLFNLIEANYKDKKHGGYIEALANDWQLLDDMRLSSKDANEPKSMNTHLHIIEPYTNLYRCWPDAELKQSIQGLLKVFRDKIIDKKTFHFNLFFDVDWSVKSNIQSYGHDIEGAWLLNEAAHFIRDKELVDELQEASLKMVDVCMNEGQDRDGSIFYEKEGGHLDTDKHWWPQAEALVGLLDAYQNTSDTKYLKAVVDVWQFVLNNVIDKKNGEWFWKVDKNGVPDLKPPKVGFWKCPYHNSRALMEAITRIKLISS
ncbi:AGE family epimerase/isomerase [Carboxylicivirga sp. N1Y90]|uniref:AGE family epimerase/isomerase n=1 Tax=Carboxylicivirga fragile TaxID=3417571 RepID=UPI003D34309F|nr:AGE family epimerase/isomerase [Marinilabiliaceae bacterium N1Y90]